MMTLPLNLCRALIILELAGGSGFDKVWSAPPTIPGPPTNVTVAAGSPFSLSVTATGALQYQWRKGGVNVTNATNATLTVASSLRADTGVYTVRVSNSSGSSNSDAATVSVLANVAWIESFSNNPTLNGWQTNQYQNLGGFSWQAARRTFTISNSSPNDSALYRSLTGLLPNHNYVLHGWVKGQSIAGGGMGANLCQWNTFNAASAPLGTFDWTNLSVTTLTTDASGTVEVACRLGFFGSTVTGTATFANLALEESQTFSDLIRPTVRTAYLIPSNRTPQTNGVSNLQKLLPVWQAWYRDQMERYGFGPKTFEFETEADGVTPKIYVVYVDMDDATMRGTNGSDKYGLASAAATSAGVPVGQPKQVWLLITEAFLMLPDSSVTGGVFLGGGGGSGDDPGTAVVDGTGLARFDPLMLTNEAAYDGVLWPAIGPYPLKNAISFVWFEGPTFSSISSSAQGGALHELTHAFGLTHDFRNDGNFNGNLMYNGCRGVRGNFYPARFPGDYTRLSYASALALNTSHYFNHGTNYTDNTPPAITVTTVASQAPTNGLAQISFTAADSGGLASALLLDTNSNVIGEMVLNGTATNAVFLTPDFIPGQSNRFAIAVYDTSGNRLVTPPFFVSIAPTNNQAPLPYLTIPSAAAVNDAVVLDASQTTAPNGNGNLQVQWDLDGDGTFDTPLSTALAITNHYSNPGVYLVRARAVDAKGNATISTPLDVRIYKPALRIDLLNQAAQLSWPVWMAGFDAQFADALSGTPDWQPMTTAVNVSGMSNNMVIPAAGIYQRFFRLARP
jgi:hypothetical protein